MTDGATDRLRNRIDHGKSSDKVNFLDPAAAPLGTDAEAAGMPDAPAAIEAEARDRPAEPGQSVRSPADVARGKGMWPTILLVLAVIIIALVGWVIWAAA